MKTIPIGNSTAQNIENNVERIVRVLVRPQPTYIAPSGRWVWPVPEGTIRPGCCTEVCSASREWWEYLFEDQKPYSKGEIVDANGMILEVENVKAGFMDDFWVWEIYVKKMPNRGTWMDDLPDDLLSAALCLEHWNEMARHTPEFNRIKELITKKAKQHESRIS